VTSEAGPAWVLFLVHRPISWVHVASALRCWIVLECSSRVRANTNSNVTVTVTYGMRICNKMQRTPCKCNAMHTHMDMYASTNVHKPTLHEQETNVATWHVRASHE